MRYCEAGPVIASSPEAARLRLSGGMLSGLLRGVRTFEVSPGGTGRTALDVREAYTGPLPGLTWRSMPDLGSSFGRFARGLKRRAGAGH